MYLIGFLEFKKERKLKSPIASQKIETSEERPL